MSSTDSQTTQSTPNKAAYYEMSTRVRYSEATQDARLSLPALINLFQDCSTFHSEHVGYGPSYLNAEQKAWVLTHWYIIIHRYPLVGEEIVAGTFANSFKSVTAMCNFYLKDGQGSYLAQANSTWAFIDITTGKPLRPSAEHVAAYQFSQALELPPEERRVKAANNPLARDPLVVRKGHIDTNNHVNNAQYIQMALDVMPDSFDEHRIARLRVDYKKAAVLGDTIYPHYAHETDDKNNERYVVELTSETGDLFGSVEFSPRCH